MKNLFSYLLKTSFFVVCSCLPCGISGQGIGDFISLAPGGQTPSFEIPSTHVFQQIIRKGDALTSGGVLPGSNDFTGYVPINGSSENGYLGINAETFSGGMTVLDLYFDSPSMLWKTTASEAVDFSPVIGTGNNCSGTVTPWNSLVSCEEAISSVDLTPEGRKVKGWCVEIDPVSKQVKDKLWALGNFKHENIVVHKNQRTVYQGADSNPGYLYKFVADKEKDLSSGDLFVFKGAKNGAGIWLKINNLTPEEQNTTLEQSGVVEATVFNGIEDVEIGPDGLIYFAVKGEGQVYRFKDSDPVAGLTVPSMETFVGNATYTIEGNTGTANANWGLGNDNLAFDKDGNLWVLQDGGLNYIWVVQKGHTQINPKVKIFGRTPSGSEPTGITFSPDFRFLFMSIQHPSGSNNSSMQEDAAGTILSFDKDVTLVIARSEHLGSSPMSLTQENESEMLGFPNPVSNHFTMLLKEPISDVKVVVLQADSKMIRTDLMENGRQFTVDLSKEAAGMYFIELWSNKTKVKVAKALKL